MSADSAVTYTSVYSEARSWSIPSEDPYEEAAQQLLEQAPRSLEFVPDPIELEDHVPAHIPEHLEDLVPAEDEAPIEAYILEVASAPTPPLPPSFLSSPMAQMRAVVPSTYHSLLPSGTPPLLPIPLHVPSLAVELRFPRLTRRLGRGYYLLFRDTERRMMTALEMVNMRVNYQVDVRSTESLEFYSRHHDVQKDRAAVRAEIERDHACSREIMRDPEREVGYGITDSWDEIVETLQGAPVSTDTELGGYVREFETRVRQDMDEIYTRLDDEQTERQLLAEARMSREAWVRATDTSDLVHGEVISLRTTALGQISEIRELQAADRRRQTVISELLRIDHRRSTETSKLRTALQGQVTALQGQVTALQAQVTTLQGQQELAGDPTQPELPEETSGIIYGRMKMAPKKAASKQTTRLNPGATSNQNQEPSTTTTTVTNAQLQAMIDQGVNAALAARDANRTGDDSHTSGTGVWRTKRVTRECTYQNFMKCQPLYFKGTEGVVELTQRFERMETVFCISNCLAENQVKYAICTFLAGALTWWNSYVRIVGNDAAYVMTWIELKKKMADKYCPRNEMKKIEMSYGTWKLERYIGGLPDLIHGSVAASKPKTMQEATEMATWLMDKKICTYAKRQAANKRKFEDTSETTKADSSLLK
nr:hypothetical protein [Tanacetum cinerariifolium]